MPSNHAANVFAKECIVTALLKLMKTMPFEEITVSDITRKAGVSRMAYYRNYESKIDILETYLNEAALFLDQSTIPLFESGDMEGYYACLFADFAKASDLYLNLLNADLGDVILRYFNRCTLRFAGRYLDAAQNRYELLALSGAVFNMAMTWLKEGTQETPRQMAQKCMAVTKFHTAWNPSVPGKPQN